jgi:methylsterol monooxygenase
LLCNARGYGLTFIWQQKIPTAKEQWQCAMLVLLSHFTVELPQIWSVYDLLLE